MFEFTREQSSAIAAISIESNQIEIAYQSNPERFYTFTASDEIIQEIEERAHQVMQNTPMLSIGRFIAELVKEGELKQVELATA